MGLSTFSSRVGWVAATSLCKHHGLVLPACALHSRPVQSAILYERICVVSNVVSADQGAGQTYSCSSCVAAGAACGPENAFRLSSRSSCQQTARDLNFVPSVDFGQECSDWCSGQGASVAYQEYTTGAPSGVCVCYGQRGSREPCRATTRFSDPTQNRYNICTGARSSAEPLWHASLTCVMSFSVSEL